MPENQPWHESGQFGQQLLHYAALVDGAALLMLTWPACVCGFADLTVPLPGLVFTLPRPALFALL